MVPKDLKLNQRNQTAAAAVGVQVPAGNRISRNGLLEQVTCETAGEILSSIIEHVFCTQGALSRWKDRSRNIGLVQFLWNPAAVHT